MFERFTEPARRLLFFARYETSATGALSIESEHMLLGLLREPGPIVSRLFAGAQVSVDQLREELHNRIEFREKVATSVEIPFSEQTKRILNYTMVEADDLGHSSIGPEHVLLALLRVPESTAGEILTGRGLRLQNARQAVAEMFVASPPPPSFRAMSATAAAVERVAKDEKEAIVEQIDRLQRLTHEAVMCIARPKEAVEILHVLHVELDSLKDRFS